MQKITVHENEHITLWYYPETKIIHHQFHKYIYGDEFRKGLNAGVEAMKKYGAIKWLSDDRNNMALPLDDVEWAKTDWFPRTLKAGWKYWALVQPAKAIGQLNMKQFTETYSKLGITVNVFSNPDEAMKWLESQ
ncbi:MAG: hypothetical protein JW925_07190 [Syntrophaceae bacterium]|nr:hypothetical protein [Syntrophaceae bacterium]